MESTAPPPDTLKALAEVSFARWRDRPAFTSMGVTLSYAELDRLSAGFGAFLRRELGLEPRERVAIMLPNLLQYPVALLGALRAGLVVVNVNPLYTAAELQYQLADSGATTVVVLENFARTLQEARAGTGVHHVITTQVGDLFPAPKRWATNFAVKRVKRMVPAFALPARCPSARRSHTMAACRRRRWRRRTWRSSSTPAAPPAGRRARCSRTPTWRPTWRRPSPGSARSSSPARRP